MKEAGQIDQRFKYLERKVGIFVFIAVGILLTTLFFMGKERGIFMKKYVLFLHVESGSDFTEGTPVKLQGFKIGKVGSLELAPGAMVKVTLELNREYQKWVRRGSVARILKEGLIGDAVVEVTPGPASGEIIEDKGELPFEKSGGIEELVKDIKPVLQEIRETLSYINNPDGDIKRAIANTEKLSEGLLNTKAELDNVLQGAEGTLREATHAMTKLDNIGKKAVPVIDKTNILMDKVLIITQETEKASKKLPEVLEKVDRVLSDVNRLSTVLSGKSYEVSRALKDTEEILSDTKDILKGAKGRWPINSMIPPGDELKLIPLDSSGRNER